MPLGYARQELLLDENGQPTDWKYLEVNAAFEKHTGIPIKGLAGKLNSEVMEDPDLCHEWLDIFYRVAYEGQEAHSIKWSEGQKRWLEFSAYSRKKGEFTTFVRDVTTFEEEKRMYADILSSISDAVFITDDAGNFKYVCPNVSNIFGYSEKEICAIGNICKLLGDDILKNNTLEDSFEVINEEKVLEDKQGNKHNLLVNIKKVEVAHGSLLFTCRDITERVKAEKKENDQTAQLKAFMNAIPDLVWIKDPDGKYISCNKEFEKLYGTAEEHIVGRSDFDFVPEEVATFSRQKDLEAIKAGAPIKNEETLNYADGSKIQAIFETTKTPVYDPNKNVLGVLGVARDITERKMQSGLFEAVFNQSPYGIALVAEDGRPYEANQSLCDMLGYEKEELLKKPFKEFTYPEDFPKDFKLYTQLTNEQIDRYEIEKRYIKKTGEIIHANLTVTLIEDPFSGTGKTALAMVSDITAKVKAQFELDLVNERYRQVLESAPDAVYVASKKGIITNVNESATKMTGYSRHELIGKPIWEIDKAWNQKSVQDFYGEFEGDHSLLIESVHHTKDEREIPVEMNVNPVMIDYDTWVIGMTRDISERKSIERKLEKSEAKYKGLIETASDPIYLVSMEGEITGVNKAACKMLGYSREELLTMTIPKIDLDWDNERVKSFGKILKVNEPVLLETYHTTKGGKQIPIEMNIQRLEIEDENFVVGIARDITERRQYEIAQENMLKDLIRAQEIANMGNWHLDVTNDVLTWSDQVYRIFGEERQSFLGTVEAFYGFVHPDERERVKMAFEKSIEHRKPYRVVHRIITRKGETKFVEEKAEIIQYPENDHIEAHGTVQDVTREVEAKRDLNLQIQKLNLAMINNGILAWETDLETGDTEVFPKEEESSKIPQINVSSPELILSQLRNEHRKFCESKLKKLQKGEIDHFTCEFQVSEDNVREWSWHKGDLAIIEKNSNGLPKRIFGTIQSINEKKDSERLQILSQEQERMRVARDIHDSIGQMLVGTRLMLNQTLTKDISHKKLKELNSSIDEMLGEMIRESRLIINNFGISLSKNETLKQTFEELVDKMKKVYPGKIKIKWIGDESLEDLATGVRVFRIFQEALTNAIKYSESDEIIVKVSNSPDFCLSVEDFGKGFIIDESDLGFGIPNMKERAHQIGGEVEIQSEPGKGTHISFKMIPD